MSSSRRAGVIAIDHGTRRTGFAVVDPFRLAPMPLDGYAGTQEGLFDHLAQLLDERDVDTLLVGDPRQADGGPGSRAREIEAFVQALRQRFPQLNVLTHDERLTSKEAESWLKEAGLHGEERKKRKDSWSAWVLLRDWIESGEPR